MQRRMTIDIPENHTACLRGFLVTLEAGVLRAVPVSEATRGFIVLFAHAEWVQNTRTVFAFEKFALVAVAGLAVL